MTNAFFLSVFHFDNNRCHGGRQEIESRANYFYDKFTKFELINYHVFESIEWCCFDPSQWWRLREGFNQNYPDPDSSFFIKINFGYRYQFSQTRSLIKISIKHYRSLLAACSEGNARLGYQLRRPSRYCGNIFASPTQYGPNMRSFCRYNKAPKRGK